MRGTTLPSSSKAASIWLRLRARWPRACLPSLAVKAESTPLPLKLAWVRSNGAKRRWSRLASQRWTRADFSTPLGPLKSITLRKLAVCCKSVQARWPPAVSSQAWAESSPKGTAVAPHWRAKRPRSGSGAFFIIAAGMDLAVEVQIDWLGQPEAGPPVRDLDAVELERIKAQLTLEGAQAQIHFVEVVVDANGAVAAHRPSDLVIEELVEVQVRIQGFDQVSAALVALGGSHAGAGMDPCVINALQPERELGIEFFERGHALPRQAQAGFKVALNGEQHSLGLTFRPGMMGLGVQ